IRRLELSGAGIIFEHQKSHVALAVDRLQLINTRDVRSCYTDLAVRKSLSSTAMADVPDWAKSNIAEQFFKKPAIVILAPVTPRLFHEPKENEFFIEGHGPNGSTETFATQLSDVAKLPR